jgi:hypothetical protein
MYSGKIAVPPGGGGIRKIIENMWYKFHQNGLSRSRDILSKSLKKVVLRKTQKKSKALCDLFKFKKICSDFSLFFKIISSKHIGP